MAKRRTRESKAISVTGSELLFRFVESNKVSYAAAGDALGVSAVAVCNWARGRTRPTESNRRAIETWTAGRVPSSAWATKTELARCVAPFSAKAGRAA